MHNTRRAIDCRPSRVTREMREQQLLQTGYRRGQDNIKKLFSNYFPGAEHGIMQGDWSTYLNTAVSVIRKDFKALCARSEQAYRTNAIARRAINILGQCIVGQGNRPYPVVRDAAGEPIEGINSQLSSDWERFNDQSIRNGTQELTDYQCQLLDFITICTYGSVLHNTVNSKKGSLLPFAFQSLKPYRLDFSKDTYYGTNSSIVDTKTIMHGMGLNEYGEPLRFYLEDGRTYEADKMSITFYPLETELYLGIPWLTPVLPQVWDHQQLFDDKMKQSRIGSRLGVKTGKRDAGDINNLLNKDTNGNDYFDLDFLGFYMGNDKPEPISMTDPISDTFKALIDMQMQYIAIGLGFSYQLFTTDLADATFSSARMNKINDSVGFSCLNKWFIKARNQKRWEKFVYWEVLTGRLAKYGVSLTEYNRDPWFFNQCFHLPMEGEAWVDPLKDIQALILAYKTGQITYQEICSKTGKHWKATLKQLAVERKELIGSGMSHLLPENISAKAPAGDAYAEPATNDSNTDPTNEEDNKNENTKP
jgi:capsid protein